ncbi:succinylglutamate desuccinylase [Noviherbaspirillum galbum]|uniref:Succinylglutamate desuccinylase n=1 Tax=Noviherbaspirillum galbum TaxID=2709383 RepID=A0A6B3SNE1_9BURK|nr:succinylglutamate desuccinylase [Noviherbaspirillum galbum]NEX60276.1 succinylglutamate desuccinylase [Noviherbaspirillum galbum]
MSHDAAAQALANADFTLIARRFADAGWAVGLPAEGILAVSAPASDGRRPRLLLSVGVHGDETAPITMLACLLDAISRMPAALACDLMLVVGNPAAIAQGKRFLEVDLNRLFRTQREGLDGMREAARADAIMQAVSAFFGGDGVNGDGLRWHLDLHTAIRPSRYPTFAVVPDVIAETEKPGLLGFLGAAGIGAAILSGSAAGTFSAWTAARFAATSATLELGQVSALAGNDPGRFADTRAAIDALLRRGKPVGGRMPEVFRVSQELTKHSDAFRMAFGKDTVNFTPLEPGSLIAEDGGTAYRVGKQTEYVVFPNPDVRPGLRAGLMVVKTSFPQVQG